MRASRKTSDTDGTDGVGHLDAGLFFVAFVRNPQTQFVAMQKVLAEKERLAQELEASIKETV